MITSIIASIRGLLELYKDLKSLVEFYQKEVKEQWYQEQFKIVESLKKATTDAERSEIAKKLAERGLFK